jgi:hypothetical protein
MVTVYELVERPDGSIGRGNLIEIEVDAAVEGIESGAYVSESAPVGVVPAGWLKKEVE